MTDLKTCATHGTNWQEGCGLCTVMKNWDKTIYAPKSIDDFDWDKYYKEHPGTTNKVAQPYFGSTFTSDRPTAEILKELGYESPEELRALRMAEDLSEDPRVQAVMAGYLSLELAKRQMEDLQEAIKTIANLQGHIRRLEKSNQELGEKLHRLTEGSGWNKNV